MQKKGGWMGYKYGLISCLISTVLLGSEKTIWDAPQWRGHFSDWLNPKRHIRMRPCSRINADTSTVNTYAWPKVNRLDWLYTNRTWRVAKAIIPHKPPLVQGFPSRVWLHGWYGTKIGTVVLLPCGFCFLQDRWDLPDYETFVDFFGAENFKIDLVSLDEEWLCPCSLE